MEKLIRRIICFALTASLVSGCATVEKVTDTAKDARSKVADTAKNAGKTVYDWATNIDTDAFKAGWNAAVDFVEDQNAVAMSSEYVDSVATAINNLKTSMSDLYGSGRTLAQDAGFAAERWTAETFNIDAAAKQTGEHASVPDSNTQGSSDLETSWGEEAQLKYYAEASDTAAAQAQTILQDYNEYKTSSKNPLTLRDWLDKNGYDQKKMDELIEAVYKDQTRIVPADQLENAKAYLNGKISKSEMYDAMSAKYGPEQTAVYEETLEHLKDRLESPKGAQSKPATYEEMQTVAQMAKDGSFDPSRFGFTLTQIIPPKVIVKQAMNTGIQTALFSIALKVGPELFQCLLNAAKEGKIDNSQLQEIGLDALTAGAEGYVNGFVSRAISTACRAGYFGQSLMSVNPDVLATMTFVAISAIRYGYALSKGEITADEYGDLMAENVVIAVGGIAGAAVMSAIFPGLGILCMAGNLAGGILAAAGLQQIKTMELIPQDGGDFIAFVSNTVSSPVKVVSDTLSKLNFCEKSTGEDNITIETTKDGSLVIKAA